MAEIKTKVNKASVPAFLRTIKNVETRKDCIRIAGMMEKATKSKGEMWGASIVGFGRRSITYANGKQNEWMNIGFSPRKNYIALYGLLVFHISHGGVEKHKDNNSFLLKLGKYKEGSGCLYIKRLADVNIKELEKIIRLATKRSS
jgi:hypothetical protein